MSTAAVTPDPWAKYEDKGDKWSQYEEKKPAVAPSSPSVLDTLGREVKSLGTSIAGMPGGIYHAFADAPTLDEKMRYEPEMNGQHLDDNSLRHRLGLGVARLTSQPIDIADEAYRNHRVGYEDALSVAPEAIGAGAAAPITAKLISSSPKAASAVVENAPKIGRTAAAIAKPAARMAVEAAADVPVVRGLIKGAKTFKDVPSKLSGIWQKAPDVAPSPNPVRQPVWSKAGTSPTSASEATGGVIEQPIPAHTVRTRSVVAPPEAIQNPVREPIWAKAGATPSTASDLTGGITEEPVPSHTPRPRPMAAPQLEPSHAPIAVPKIGDLAKQVVKAAGGNPEEPVANLSPGKPIARRPIAVAPAAPKDLSPVEEVPKGIPQATPELKPVDSSALSGYHYDPQSKTMTIGTKSGGMYRYGEVTPEEAKAFESSDSKGRAYKDIRDNHVQTAKRVGEKWVSGKPSAVTASPDSDVVQVKPLTPKIATRGDDLEATLAKSIQIAKAKKK